MARSPEPLFELAALLKDQGCQVYAQPTDLTQPQEVERFTKGALAEFGRIDVLINNAGTTGNPLPFDQLEDSDWHEVLELNVMGAVRMTRAVLPVMQTQSSGSIFFFASESGIQPDPFMPHQRLQGRPTSSFQSAGCLVRPKYQGQCRIAGPPPELKT